MFNSLDKNISGRVFVDLAETDLKGYGFVSSGLITMRSILREVCTQQGLTELDVAYFIFTSRLHYI